MFSTAYEAGVPWNDSQWDDTDFQALLYQGRAELDSDNRRMIYREMQEILPTLGGVIVPMFANYVDAASSNFAHGPDIGNTWQMDGTRIAERRWFA